MPWKFPELPHPQWLQKEPQHISEQPWYLTFLLHTEGGCRPQGFRQLASWATEPSFLFFLILCNTKDQTQGPHTKLYPPAFYSCFILK